MPSSKAGVLAVSVALAALTGQAMAQSSGQFSEDQVKRGADIYAQNCSPCHGPRMKSPEVPVDLLKFPPGEKARFIVSVAKGKNQMPPWGGLLSAEEIEALWAYVVAGEKQ